MKFIGEFNERGWAYHWNTCTRGEEESITYSRPPDTAIAMGAMKFPASVPHAPNDVVNSPVSLDSTQIRWQSWSATSKSPLRAKATSKGSFKYFAPIVRVAKPVATLNKQT